MKTLILCECCKDEMIEDYDCLEVTKTKYDYYGHCDKCHNSGHGDKHWLIKMNRTEFIIDFSAIDEDLTWSLRVTNSAQVEKAIRPFGNREHELTAVHCVFSLDDHSAKIETLQDLLKFFKRVEALPHIDERVILELMDDYSSEYIDHIVFNDLIYGPYDSVNDYLIQFLSDSGCEIPDWLKGYIDFETCFTEQFDLSMNYKTYEYHDQVYVLDGC